MQAARAGLLHRVPPKKYLTSHWFVEWGTYEGSELFQIDFKSLSDHLDNQGSLEPSQIPYSTNQ